MNTQLVSKKWLGVTLLAALLSLLAVGSLTAQETEASAVAAAVPCDFAEIDSSSSPSFTGLNLVCGNAAALQVHGVEFARDFAVIQVVVDGEIEPGLYRQSATGWERLELVFTTDDELAYMDELEDAGAGETSGPGFSSPAPVVRTGGGTRAGQADAYENYLRALENEWAGGTPGTESFDPAPVVRTDGRTWAVQGEAYEEYLRELENEWAGEAPGARTFDSAPIVRTGGRTWAVQGEAYEEYLDEIEDASAEGTLTPDWFAGAPALRPDGDTWSNDDIQSSADLWEPYEDYLRELEGLSTAAPGLGKKIDAWSVHAEAYWNYLIEEEESWIEAQ